MDNPAAANALGILGAVCWSVQLLPQIAINALRDTHTEGLQPSMMLLWACAGVPLGVYNIVSEFNIALRIQPQILTLLSLITWCQCCYYDKKWSLRRCASWLIAMGLLMGGIEVALVFALRNSYTKNHRIQGARDEEERLKDWPTTLVAILSAALLAAGVLRHYWDIYTHQTVRGISFVFVGIDAAGDLFSLVSIFFQQTLDVLGTTIYGTELALWIGVFACGGWFNLMPFMRQMLSRYRNNTNTHQTDRQHELIEAPTHSRASGNAIAVHNAPSSTSVFRTPSSEFLEHRITRSLEV